MIENVANWIINIISTLGYPGIVLTMAIESACIPLPSEIIMPFSGYLVSTGRFSLPLITLSGALGNLIGSTVAYSLGYYGHEKVIKAFFRRWGKFILISEDELDTAEKLIHKHKDKVVLLSRVVPGVRTVISLPAGFAKIPYPRFAVLTFVGSLIWSYFLGYIGFVLGENWQSIGPYFRKADIIILIIVISGVAFYVYHKIGKSHKNKLLQSN